MTSQPEDLDAAAARDAAARRGRRWLIGTGLAVAAVVGGVALLASAGDGADVGAGSMPGMDMGGMDMGATPGDDGAPPTAPTADEPVPARDPEVVALELRDYEVLPTQLALVEGAYTFNATNDDGVPHDVTLIRTDLPVDALPTSGARLVEDDLDVRARTSTIVGGDVGTLAAVLRPGRYLLVCTVPHHYVRERMVAEVVVSPGE